MYSGLCVVTVNPFNNGKVDKNGKAPVILDVAAGKVPNRTVLSGTIAENAGFEEGKTYLASCREGEPDAEYGRRFVFTKRKELSALEIIEAEGMLGVATVFNVEAVEEHTNAGAEAMKANEKFDG